MKLAASFSFGALSGAHSRQEHWSQNLGKVGREVLRVEVIVCPPSFPRAHERTLLSPHHLQQTPFHPPHSTDINDSSKYHLITDAAAPPGMADQQPRKHPQPPAAARKDAKVKHDLFAEAMAALRSLATQLDKMTAGHEAQLEDHRQFLERMQAESGMIPTGEHKGGSLGASDTFAAAVV